MGIELILLLHHFLELSLFGLYLTHVVGQLTAQGQITVLFQAKPILHFEWFHWLVITQNILELLINFLQKIIRLLQSCKRLFIVLFSYLKAILLIILLEQKTGATINQRLIETKVGEVGPSTYDHIFRLNIDVRLNIHGLGQY